MGEKLCCRLSKEILEALPVGGEDEMVFAALEAVDELVRGGLPAFFAFVDELDSHDAGFGVVECGFFSGDHYEFGVEGVFFDDLVVVEIAVDFGRL